MVTELEYCPHDGARLIELEVEDGDPLIGTLFDDRYDIEHLLGEGGMSTVYGARQADFDRRVAIKILKADYLRDENIRRRFMYEARIIANLQHPNAVRLFDFGQAPDGSFYMVMELLEGESLADRLAHRFLTYREIFNIVPPICGVLGEAHRKDVVHRDLKPENIFLLQVEGDGGSLEFAKLLDFGIAKHLASDRMTKSGTLWGTPAYMSPEQARGEVVGSHADTYAIGLILYELICGNLPFQASTNMGYAVKHMHERVRSLATVPGLYSVPPELDDLILSCLDKYPEGRPSSMEQIANTLDALREQYFDDALLDSVPAEEVDPVALQAWVQASENGEVPRVDESGNAAPVRVQTPDRRRRDTPMASSLDSTRLHRREISRARPGFESPIEGLEVLDQSIDDIEVLDDSAFLHDDRSASSSRPLYIMIAAATVVVAGIALVSFVLFSSSNSKRTPPQADPLVAIADTTADNGPDHKAHIEAKAKAKAEAKAEVKVNYATAAAGNAATLAASTVLHARQTAIVLGKPKTVDTPLEVKQAPAVVAPLHKGKKRTRPTKRRRPKRTIRNKTTKDAIRGTF